MTPLCRTHHVAVHEWLKTNGRLKVSHTKYAVMYLKGLPIPKRSRKSLARQKRREEYRALMGADDPVVAMMAKLRQLQPKKDILKKAEKMARKGQARNIYGMIAGVQTQRGRRAKRKSK